MSGECCQYCGARLQGRWERLTPGLVRALIKFKRQILINGQNAYNVSASPFFSHNEKANWQKLRFHGLIAKVEAEGDDVKGLWCLTKRGNQFLKAQIAIAPKVFIFRNHIERRCEDNPLTIGEILKNEQLPVFDEKEDFLYEDMGIQADLFS